MGLIDIPSFGKIEETELPNVIEALASHCKDEQQFVIDQETGEPMVDPETGEPTGEKESVYTEVQRAKRRIWERIRWDYDDWQTKKAALNSKKLSMDKFKD